jgi:hypothetical protein
MTQNLDMEHHAVHLAVAGGEGAGKNAIANRLAHDLRVPGEAQHAFHSGRDLAAAATRFAAPARHHLFAYQGSTYVLAERLPDDMTDGALIVVDVLTGLDVEGRAALHAAARHHVPQIVVAVNKMDRVGYEFEVFKTLADEIVAEARSYGAENVTVIPVSAWRGDNIVAHGENFDWYRGETLAEWFALTARRNAPAPAH